MPWARSGYLAVPRTSDYVLAPTERGAIDNLRVTEMEPASPAGGQVQVRVEAAGVNFRDVLNVLGLYPGDPGPVGGDFAGTVTATGRTSPNSSLDNGSSACGRARWPAGSMCPSNCWHWCPSGSAR